MSLSNNIFTDFSTGEVSPLFEGRWDIQEYPKGLRKCENYRIIPQGGLQVREGTKYVKRTPNDARVRLVEFIYSRTEAYVLEFSALSLRILGFDTTTNEPVQFGAAIATPFLQAEIDTLDFAQSGNKAFITHSNHPPQILTKNSPTSWTLTTFSDSGGTLNPVATVNPNYDYSQAGLAPWQRNTVLGVPFHNSGETELWNRLVPSATGRRRVTVTVPSSLYSLWNNTHQACDTYVGSPVVTNISRNDALSEGTIVLMDDAGIDESHLLTRVKSFDGLVINGQPVHYKNYASSTAYNLDDVVLSPDNSSWYFRCVQSGTSSVGSGTSFSTFGTGGWTSGNISVTVNGGPSIVQAPIGSSRMISVVDPSQTAPSTGSVTLTLNGVAYTYSWTGTKAVGLVMFAIAALIVSAGYQATWAYSNSNFIVADNAQNSCNMGFVWSATGGGSSFVLGTPFYTSNALDATMAALAVQITSGGDVATWSPSLSQLIVYGSTAPVVVWTMTSVVGFTGSLLASPVVTTSSGAGPFAGANPSTGLVADGPDVRWIAMGLQMTLYDPVQKTNTWVSGGGTYFQSMLLSTTWETAAGSNLVTIAVQGSGFSFGADDVDSIIQCGSAVNSNYFLGYFKIYSVDAVANTCRAYCLTPPMWNAGSISTWSTQVIKWSSWNSGRSGYPSCCVIHEQRLVLANTSFDPQIAWGSVTGNSENFNIGQQNETDSFAFQVAASDVSPIRWLVSCRILLVGTEGGEYRISGTSSFFPTPLTPKSVDIRPQTAWGAGDVKAQRVGQSVFFIDRSQRKLLRLDYIQTFDNYLAADMVHIAEHISLGGIKKLCWQAFPNYTLWAVRGDGQLVGLSYVPELKMQAWQRIKTDGYIESVACIPDATGEFDRLWISCHRVNDVAGMIALYKFDGQSLDTYVKEEISNISPIDPKEYEDLSGYFWRQLDTNTAWQAGVFGNAAHLNGDKEFISLNPHAMTESGDFSWAFYVKPGVNVNSSLPADATIAYYGDNPSTNDVSVLFRGVSSENGFGSTGQLIFKMNCAPSSISWKHVESNSSAWTAGQWYFIVVTFSHLNGLRMYVNGVLQTSIDTNQYTRGIIISKHFTIGVKYTVDSPPPSYVGHYNGAIDHFRIFNRELNLSEVKSLWGTGV